MSTTQEKREAVEHAIGQLKKSIERSKKCIALGESVQWHQDNIKRAEEIIAKGESWLPNYNTHPPHEDDEAW